MYNNLYNYSEHRTLSDRLTKSKESLKGYQKVQEGIMGVNFMQQYVKIRLELILH